MAPLASPSPFNWSPPRTKVLWQSHNTCHLKWIISRPRRWGEEFSDKSCNALTTYSQSPLSLISATKRASTERGGGRDRKSKQLNKVHYCTFGPCTSIRVDPISVGLRSTKFQKPITPPIFIFCKMTYTASELGTSNFENNNWRRFVIQPTSFPSYSWSWRNPIESPVLSELVSEYNWTWFQSAAGLNWGVSHSLCDFTRVPTQEVMGRQIKKHHTNNWCLGINKINGAIFLSPPAPDSGCDFLIDSFVITINRPTNHQFLLTPTSKTKTSSLDGKCSMFRRPRLDHTVNLFDR